MIYLLGAGAMGCLWAARLQSQHEVRFLCTPDYAASKKWIHAPAKRQAHLPAQQTLPDRCYNDLTEGSADNTPRSLCIPQERADQPLVSKALILVTTKSYAVRQALVALKPRLNRDHQVVLFQNGLGSQQEACSILNDIPCFAAVTTEAVNLRTPNQLVHAARGTTRIGPLNPAAHNMGINVEPGELKRLKDSGLDIVFQAEIWSTLWRKLAINCAINPFTAIEKCRNGEVASSPLFQQLWPDLLNELNAMMQQAGFPCTPNELEHMVLKVMHDTRDNISSMLQDRQAGRPTEIDDINGFAARYLAQHGHCNRANRKLTERVHALGD